MKTIISSLFVLVALLSLPVAAQNAHFTFKIPIELTKLHRDIDKIHVQVFLFDGQAETNQYSYSGHPSDPGQAKGRAVARKSVSIPVSSSGSVSRTVTLTMNTKKPAEVVSYTCVLYLHSKKTNEWTFWCRKKKPWCLNYFGLQPYLFKTGQI